MIFLAEAVAAQADFVAFKHKFRYYFRLANCSSGYVLQNVFGESSNTAHLSERLANLIILSEEHWKNDEIPFQNGNGHRESVN